MDVIFIPAKIKINELKNFDKLLKILPKKIGIVCLLQYIDVTNKIILELKKLGYETLYSNSLFILGCNVKNADLPADTILLIGDGKFHALEIVRSLKKDVIIYNPISGEINTISKENYKKYHTNILYLIEKLKNSNNIGIAISIKPGQYDQNSLKWILEKLKDKNLYL
ncbi:MAG: diphthamide synthesis protein, partial [Nanopusillaceae archaeon]